MFEMLKNNEEIDQRFGDRFDLLKIEKYEHLREVESYFIEIMKNYPTNYCYDLTAFEHPYFDNINYTIFSDFFMMKPLQPDLSNIQINEALIYGDSFKIDYFQIYSELLKNKNLNKYKTKSTNVSNIEAVVALPGGNLLDKICFNKLKWIYRTHGKFAIFKPHPLTEPIEIDMLYEKIHKHINIANYDDDLYEYIKVADIVYSTHSSESVFYSLCLGKKVEPIDTFQHRMFGSFSHINNHLFETDNRKLVINKIFNDYRSGLINPIYQKDWKDRIEKYLDYIHEKRLNYRYKYIQQIP